MREAERYWCSVWMPMLPSSAHLSQSVSRPSATAFATASLGSVSPPCPISMETASLIWLPDGRDARLQASLQTSTVHRQPVTRAQSTSSTWTHPIAAIVATTASPMNGQLLSTGLAGLVQVSPCFALPSTTTLSDHIVSPSVPPSVSPRAGRREARLPHLGLEKSGYFPSKAFQLRPRCHHPRHRLRHHSHPSCRLRRPIHLAPHSLPRGRRHWCHPRVLHHRLHYHQDTPLSRRFRHSSHRSHQPLHLRRHCPPPPRLHRCPLRRLHPCRCSQGLRFASKSNSRSTSPDIL